MKTCTAIARTAMLMVGTPSPDLAGLAVVAGCEAIILDGEHGYPLDSVRPVVDAIHAAGGKCLVRLRRDDYLPVGALGDQGVDGFIIPNLTEVAVATQVADRARFGRGHLRGINPFVPAASVPGDLEALTSVDRQPELWLMAETRQFVDQARDGALAEASLSVTGIVVGPYDLATDLGCAVSPDEPVLLQAVEDLAAAANAAGIRWAMFARDPGVLAQWRDRGIDPPGVIVGYDRDVWYQECVRRVAHAVEGAKGQGNH